jgi:hypothetical protein
MNLDENRDKKILTFRNPPILKGLESNMVELNKKDKLSAKEKIWNNIIKSEDDNKYFSEMKNEAMSSIRAPPNFLY